MISIAAIIAALIAVDVNRSLVIFAIVVILLARIIAIPVGGYYRDKMKAE